MPGIINRYICYIAAILYLLQTAAWAEIALEIPTDFPAIYATSDDYFTEVLHNPADFDSESDLNFLIPERDSGSGITDLEIADGLLSFKTAEADSYLYFLSPGIDTIYSDSLNGENFPLNPDRYRVFSFKAYSSVAGTFRLRWSSGDSETITRTTSVPMHAGWHIYKLSLNTAILAGNGTAWLESGIIKSFGVDFDHAADIQIDWVMLSRSGSRSIGIPVAFTPEPGAAIFNLYLDDDQDRTNGYVDVRRHNSSDSTLDLSIENLAAGEYFVTAINSSDFATLYDNPWDGSDIAMVDDSFGLADLVSEAGFLEGKAVVRDGFFSLATGGQEIDAGTFRYLTIALSLGATASVTVEWLDSSGVPLGQMSLPGAPGYRYYTFDLQSSGTWLGSVASLRIRPGSEVLNAVFRLDFVALTTDSFVTALSTPVTVVADQSITMNRPPEITILQPSRIGGKDFATDNRGGPWNMNSAVDIAAVGNLSSATLFPSTTISGRRGDFFCATSSATDGPPFQEFFVARRGDRRIDASFYKNLTVTGYIDADASLAGNLSRIFLSPDFSKGYFTGEGTYPFTGTKKWFTYTRDLSDLRKDAGQSAGENDLIWKGLIDAFRLTLHEYQSPVAYCVDEVSLRSDDIANNSFAIVYQSSDRDNPEDAVVSLYYSSIDGAVTWQPIATDLPLSGSGVFIWDTSQLANGTYVVHAQAKDRYNKVDDTSHRLVIDHSLAVDTTPPVLKLYGPQQGTQVGSRLQTGGFAIDDSGIAAIEAAIDGIYLGTFQTDLFAREARDQFPAYADASRAGFLESFSLSGLAPGLRTLTITAYDKSGNSTFSSVGISIGSGQQPFIMIPGSDLPGVPMNTEGSFQFNAAYALKKKRGEFTAVAMNASLCSSVELIGYPSVRKLRRNAVGNATVLSTVSNPAAVVKFTARGLKAIGTKRRGRAAKLRKKPLVLGLRCDGTLFETFRLKTSELKKRRKVASVPEFFQLFSGLIEIR